MIAASPKPIQGLFDAEGSCQSFWSLLAKIELSSFIKNDVESLEKEHKKPYPSEANRRG